MIDGSKRRKRQLAFELQNSRVYEKHSITVAKVKFNKRSKFLLCKMPKKKIVPFESSFKEVSYEW